MRIHFVRITSILLWAGLSLVLNLECAQAGILRYCGDGFPTHILYGDMNGLFSYSIDPVVPIKNSNTGIDVSKSSELLFANAEWSPVLTTKRAGVPFSIKGYYSENCAVVLGKRAKTDSAPYDPILCVTALHSSQGEFSIPKYISLNATMLRTLRGSETVLRAEDIDIIEIVFDEANSVCDIVLFSHLSQRLYRLSVVLTDETASLTETLDLSNFTPVNVLGSWKNCQVVIIQTQVKGIVILDDIANGSIGNQTHLSLDVNLHEYWAPLQGSYHYDTRFYLSTGKMLLGINTSDNHIHILTEDGLSQNNGLVFIQSASNAEARLAFINLDDPLSGSGQQFYSRKVMTRLND